MSLPASRIGIVAACIVLAQASARANAQFVESRLVFDAEIIATDVVDVDLDGRRDLIVVIGEKNARRFELHLQRPDHSLVAEPDWVLRLPPEVVACAFFDARGEPGKELLLLTPNGVLSVSLTKPGLAGNARVELRTPVFPELSQVDRLILWPWLLDVDTDGEDELLLPERGGLSVYGAVGAGDDRHLELESVIPSLYQAEDRPHLPRLLGGDEEELDVDVRALQLFPFAPTSLPKLARPPLLHTERRWTLPHLGFWNADRRPDVVLVQRKALIVLLQLEDRAFATAIRLPQPTIDWKDEERTFELVDFDDDGRSELVRITRDATGTEREFEVVVFSIGDDSRPVDEPRSALRFKAADAELAFRDADGDGATDLVVRSAQLPIGISSLAAVKVDVALEIYRGRKGGPLSRKPDARFARTYSPERLSRLKEAEIFHLSGDYDGDGKGDLLFMDDEGRLHLHALRSTGDSIEFSSDPIVPPYMPPATLLSCWAYDFSEDGVSDLCLLFEKGLIALISRKDGGA